MKKGDRSLYYHEDIYQRTGDDEDLSFSTSSDEEGGPTSPGAASPEPSEQEAINVEDWLCLDASGSAGLPMSGGCGKPPADAAHTECPAPRTWLSVFQASLPARRSTGCRWALTGEFLHALALRMPLLRAAAALGMSAAALRAACRKVGMRSWDHRHHALAARAVATVDWRGNTQATTYLLSVRQRLGCKRCAGGQRAQSP